MKVTVFLILLSCALLLINVLYGSVEISFFNWQELSSSERELLWKIVLESRLPRSIGAYAGGAALATSGLILQHIFRNVLAGPTTLGVNAGASLGVALFYFLLGAASSGLSWMGAGGFAMLGALLFLGLTLAATKRFRVPNTVLIVGLLLGYLSFALIEVLVQKSGGAAAAAYMFWGMGSFNALSIAMAVVALGVALLLLGWAIFKNKKFDLYLLGDDEMIMNGIKVESFRMQSFVVVGTVVGVITALLGPLAFVGIAVPNLIKLFGRSVAFGPLLIKSFLLGGVFCLFADLLSRGVVLDVVLPVNAMLCVLAFPVVVLMFAQRKKGI